MAPGEKRRFWIPAALAYGENPGGGRRLLLFRVGEVVLESSWFSELLAFRRILEESGNSI